MNDILDSTILKLIEIKSLFVGYQSSDLTESEKDFIGEQIKKKLNVLKNYLIYELKKNKNNLKLISGENGEKIGSDN